MASIIRPVLLKQTCIAAASKRAFTIKSSPSFSSTITKAVSVESRPTIRAAFVQDSIRSTRVAAFHTTGRQSILPPPPQVIEGTANDAAHVPTPSPSHGSYHWTFERLISAALIPLTIAPFAAGSLNPATDAILCGAVLIHSHIGFEAMVTDYFPQKRVPKTRKAFEWALKGATVLVGVALYEFETNDVGVTEAIKRIWKA